MALALIYPGRSMDAWRDALQAADLDLDIRVWPELGDLSDIEFALTWAPPPGLLGSLPNLKAVSSMGDGVEHILEDPDYPRDVPLARLVDEDLPFAVTQYVVHAVIEAHRGFEAYRRCQQRRCWQRQERPHFSRWTVGLMGYGRMGREAARMLMQLRYPVRAWARRAHPEAEVPVWHGTDQLGPFLESLRALVCLLPVTPDTEGILNAELFARLPRGATLINPGRGQLVVERDLLAALDSGQLAGARLDVFRQEPLPVNHPFWGHPLVEITPHVAAGNTTADYLKSAVPIVLENLNRARSGHPLIDQVDLAHGY